MTPGLGLRTVHAGMSHKSEKIAGLIQALRGRELDAHYLGYFHCFNDRLFFEAHEVLEELWLADKHGPQGRFYKGLIQLAGAFVHVQKKRPKPAAALFRLARENLEGYPHLHQRLDVSALVRLIDSWLARLETAYPADAAAMDPGFPRLVLLEAP